VSRRLPAATAIVLAGGRSRRFGRDKLAEPVAGGTLLDRAIAAVGAVAREVVVVGPATGPRELPARRRVPVRSIADDEAFPGPLVAVAGGLEVAAEPLALIVGGDMPTLAQPVLEALLRPLAADAGIDAVCLAYRGRRQPLPMAVRVGAATAAARRLIGAGERRLLTLTESLPARELAEGEWRPLDPNAATLRDVDRPADLDGLG
jgi:molybdopterin-guanine dinucleotide biosynthesis protein A